MTWRRARKRQRELQQFHAHHELLTMTTIVQIIEEEEERPRRGSIVGRKMVPRDRFSGYWRLMQDYFLDPPVFDDNHFRCRFRMCKAMFIDICHAVAARNDYFKRKPNAAGLPGFTTVQKVTVALRLLAYGGCADCLVEYIRMGETTILESLDHFTRTVIDLYGQSYLRPPNAEDISRPLRKAEERGFPGMICSIDCMQSGRSALQVGTVNIGAITRNLQLSLRL